MGIMGGLWCASLSANQKIAVAKSMSDASRVRIERSRVRNVIRVTARDHCVYFQHSERECAKSTGNHVDGAIQEH